MTTKINGAAYPGIWVERKVAFIKLTFSSDISAIPAADLYELGTTTPVSTGTVATSVFGIVGSALVQALQTLETGATVLAISAYDATAFSVDVMLGNAESWFSDASGFIPAAGTPFPVLQAQAEITVAGSAAADSIGTLVSIAPTAVTFTMNYAYLNGNMAAGTAANGALVLGVGATSGAYPTNSPTGTPGYYPASLDD